MPLRLTYPHLLERISCLLKWTLHLPHRASISLNNSLESRGTQSQSQSADLIMKVKSNYLTANTYSVFTKSLHFAKPYTHHYCLESPSTPYGADSVIVPTLQI